jgi:large subunit ribosomal protein L6
MSRIGNKPVPVSKTTEVTIGDGKITVKGAKASLEQVFPEIITIEKEDDQIVLKRTDDSREAKSKHGLYRSLVNNMVIGVEAGFKKELEIRGVGYRAALKGNSLSLTLGFSHPIDHPIPEGITVEVNNNTMISVSGADKQLVGQIASDIRGYRPPENYKGKGVRYVDEYVPLKEGKSV